MASPFRRPVTTLRGGVELSPSPLMSVQPSSLKNPPPGWLSLAAYTLYTDTELIAAQQLNAYLPADVVVIDGDECVVLWVDPWQNGVINHFEVMASLPADIGPVTYWGTPTPDGFGGFTYATPRLSRGRWQDRQELYVDRAGQQVRSRAMAWTLHDLEIDGYLAFGDFTGQADPTKVVPAHRIEALEQIPALSGTEHERRAWM